MRTRAQTAFVSAALCAVTLLPGTGHASDGTWTQLVQIAGFERSTPAVGAIGDSIYIFGGVRDDFRTGLAVFYNDLARFDTGTQTMHTLKAKGIPPLPRAFAAGVGDEARGKLYVYGGATYQANFVGFYAHDDLHEYDVAKNKWKRLGPLTGGPQGRSRPSMWLHGDKLYVFGGVNALLQTLNDLWSFDLTTKQWAEVIPNGATTSPQSRHEALSGQFAAGGKLTIYSGEHVDLLSPEVFSIPGDTWSYDIATTTWTQHHPASDVEPARNYGSAAVVGNALYMHAGDIPGGSQGCGAPFPQNPSEELWRLDLTSHEWTKLSPAGDPLVPLKRSVATVVDGTMYVLAGFDFDCEELTSPGQIWNSWIYTYTP